MHISPHRKLPHPIFDPRTSFDPNPLHMTTSALASAAPSNSTHTIANKSLGLKPEDFIKMMITQLQNQDPLQPAKNEELLAQMSQIGQLQSSTELQANLKSLVLQNNIGAAGNLIGKMVQGLDARGAQVKGLVNSIKVIEGSVSLELDNGKTLAMDHVTSVASAPAATAKTSKK
jgi:flagellar basal-body rod modification protein FlgD